MYGHNCIVLGIQVTQWMKKSVIIGLLLCTIITCQLGYSVQVTKATKMELIEARIFLDDTFLKKIMYILAIIRGVYK